MTAATLLTLSRIVALPAVAILILTERQPLALFLFVVAALTDWADGLVARRWNQVTNTGARLDALVDKVFVLGLVLLLCHVGVFAWPIVAVVVIRDIAVQLWRREAPAAQPIPANRSGKSKFLLQCVAIGAAVLATAIDNGSSLSVFANATLLLAFVVSLPGSLIVWRARRPA